MSDRTNLVKEILKSSGYWVLNKTIAKEFGIDGALLLSVFAEAETMMGDEEGWFYQTAETIEEITGLSRFKQDNIITELEKQGIIKKEVRGIPAKRYFKLDCEPLANKFVNNSQTSMQEIRKQDCEKLATNKEHNNKERNKERNNKEPSAYDLLSEGLKSTFDEYRKMRKEMKSKMTDRAETLLINKLNKMATTDKEKIDILNQSIMNGWKSVYPIKDNMQSKKEKSQDEIFDEYRRKYVDPQMNSEGDFFDPF